MGYSSCTANHCWELRLGTLFHDERQGSQLQNGSVADVTYWTINRTLLRNSDCPLLWLYRSYRRSSGNKLSAYIKVRTQNKSGLNAPIFISLHPVNSDVQTKPNDVNKVPIPSSTLKRKMVFSSKVAADHATENNRQHQAAKEYVEAMETSQHKEG